MEMEQKFENVNLGKAPAENAVLKGRPRSIGLGRAPFPPALAGSISPAGAFILVSTEEGNPGAASAAEAPRAG
jgi:hypothetical protein